MRTIGIAAALLACSIATPARAESRCVGHAVWGALVGAMVFGDGLALVAQESGHPSSTIAHVAAGGMAFGATVGPIVTCGAFSDEHHPLPAATFVIGGTLVVGGASVLLAMREVPTPRYTERCPTPDCGRGKASAALSFAGITGMTLGALGGYYLHRRIFGTHDESYVVPLAAPGVTGMIVGTQF